MPLAALVLSALAFAAPAASTGDATSVTPSSAVVRGTVDPNGEATRYWVEYGTSTSYGIRSPEQTTAAGDDPVEVSVPLTGLRGSTTYQYRLVAANASGESAGVNRSFATTAAPSISSRSVVGVNAAGATVRARVNPRGAATTVRVEYGTTSAYGLSTPEQPVGAGRSAVPVDVALTGLAPNTRYHYRFVATSAAGVTRQGNRTFRTSAAPTGVSITPSTVRPVYGSGLTVRGSVTGVNRVRVALEKQDFPYSGPFTEIASATSNSRGAFTLTAPPLYITARLRVVTRTAVVASSPVTTASVAVKVGLKSRRLRGNRVRIEGATWPAVPEGRVSLQRQTKSGRWIFVKRGRISSLSGNRSRYRFSAVARRKRALNYRVVVLARTGGAHVPGTSRTITVPARRR